MEQDLSNIPIIRLGLPNRIKLALSRAGCTNLENLPKSFEDLLQIRSIGIMSAIDIINAVKKFGITIDIPNKYIYKPFKDCL